MATQEARRVQQTYVPYGQNNTNNDDEFADLYEESTVTHKRSLPQKALGGGDFPNVPPNPLSKFLAKFLKSVVELSIDVSQELYTNSSVIVIAAGLAGGVHHFASQYSSLTTPALEAGFHGSVAVAKYVGLAFFIKTALTPIHEAFTSEKYSKNNEESALSPKVRRAKKAVNSHVVSYLTPMALAWIVAYTQGIPVKLGFATVYTIGIFGIMKFLNRGYDYALTKYEQSQQRPLSKD